jgi:uncharacterized protein
MIGFTRERLIGIIVGVILGGVAFVFGLRWLEFAITFHPVRVPANQTLAVPAGGEEVWFTAADGTRLHGWFFQSESQPETATIIYFHGNITNTDWVGQRLARRGFDVLLFDYRGYGKSEGDVGAESGLYAVGDAALAFVINQKGARPDRVVLYGQSLGTTVAADIASRQNVGAVILESGLSSASSVGRAALPWLPAWLHVLATNRFESAKVVPSESAGVDHSRRSGSGHSHRRSAHTFCGRKRAEAVIDLSRRRSQCVWLAGR